MLSVDLEAKFPNLKITGYMVTSPKTKFYNCIAWAAGDDTRWWWPDNYFNITYWPRGVPREETIESFVQAFNTLNYEVCSDGTLEPGYEKVVIYAKGGVPTHAARQLGTGVWVSKLGQEEDIEHSAVNGVESSIYGAAAQYLKRPSSNE